jgi:hypothetical protein
MFKVIPKWDEERYEQKSQEAFAEAFENIMEDFQNESDTESDTDSDIDEYGSDFDFDEDDDTQWWTPSYSWRSEMTLDDIMYIQERFNLLSRSGYVIEPEILENDYYKLTINSGTYWYENTPTEDFVSKHKGVRQGHKRIGARRMEKVTRSLEELVEIVVVCV